MPSAEGNRQRQLLLDRMMSTDPWAGGLSPFAEPLTRVTGLPMFGVQFHLAALERAHAEANPAGAPNRTPSQNTLNRLGLGGAGGDGNGGGSSQDQLKATLRDQALRQWEVADRNTSKTGAGLPMFGAGYQQAALELIRMKQGPQNDRTPSAALLARIGSPGQPAGLPPGAVDQTDATGAPRLATNIPPTFDVRKKRRRDGIFGAS